MVVCVCVCVCVCLFSPYLPSHYCVVTDGTLVPLWFVVQQAYFCLPSSLTPVSSLQPLDRDPPHGRPQWRLRVTATDGELEAHTDIRVNLKDANDNAPFFPSRTTTATVSEDTPLGNMDADQSCLVDQTIMSLSLPIPPIFITEENNINT